MTTPASLRTSIVISVFLGVDLRRDEAVRAERDAPNPSVRGPCAVLHRREGWVLGGVRLVRRVEPAVLLAFARSAQMASARSLFTMSSIICGDWPTALARFLR